MTSIRTAMAQPQLVMERGELGDVPAAAVPAGYRLRIYQEGDAAQWCRIVNAAIGGEHRPEGFEAAVSDPLGFDPENVLFVETGGEAVGTGSATWRPQFGQDAGYVHMVGVDAAHRGKGLGRALVLAVLRRLWEQGFGRAVLETDDFRLPAIGLYLSLGFRPRVTPESHEARWREVYQKLGLPERRAEGG